MKYYFIAREGEAAPSFDVYAKWDKYGYVAKCDAFPKIASRHCGGPRAAAEELCRALCERPGEKVAYKLVSGDNKNRTTRAYNYKLTLETRPLPKRSQSTLP